MPELPEVETTCRDLQRNPLRGKPIEQVDINWHRSIGTMEEHAFIAKVVGRSIVDISRRGKYIHLHLDDGQSLLVHLRMSGSLVTRRNDVDLHDRIVLRFGTLCLCLHDPRKFARMILTSSPEAILGSLGPEPFDPLLDNGTFHGMLHDTHRKVKAVLLDQTKIAGIGNIYADESLFLARIHPATPAHSIDEDQSNRLLHAIRAVLVEGLAHRGTSLGKGESNFASDGHAGNNGGNLRVFRRTGLPCPNCNTPIERIVVVQRSTHFCPHCQPPN